MLKVLLAGLALLATAAAPARAVQVCAWIDETVGEDDYHELALWLEADGDADFFYRIKGEGLSGEGMKAHSPSSGTYVLHAREPGRPWNFGATLTPPGAIDVVIALRAMPKDIFSDEETPLLAAFTFKRNVPAGETAPPKDLSARQCATLKAP
ncbi:MAG: hypothetical protein A2790_15665 [Phenylobacterium sp. RIFCSPHIGHO2_01_FULL_69_31]|jgi:hypothetical protein|uniref:hypothetical protein n=1 Tax=Phenylobacterium sp. RIFCSPHIGHO2_01_FULL_69_31 TaxID=1801944 RepID=UPI0008B74CA1|nr:hypothetical protein [Phenylobacterium sp. RIFCSPHIGHO2_01_FULL_69_31]OHB28452.1 MAG: hypothetical protein A2790_15665 [Phenylobacterium sp. RIFCSPHIGHO2_01_FULL_69_31]